MKRGFTLVELLGVIIILSLLMLLVIPKITNSIRNSSNKTDDLTKEMIYYATKLHISENEDLYKKEDGKSYCISLSTLVNEGNLKSPITLSNSKEDLTNLKSVKVIYNDGFKYEIIDNEECTICKLVKGDSKEIGSKYKCNLDKERTFYVLSKTENSVSLIMNRNFTDGDGTNGTIPKILAWCTDGGSNHKTCKNINTTGTDAPEGKDYIGHITEVFNTPGVTVSFPSADQVASADGKNYLDYPSLSMWLTDYLYGTTHSVSNVYGYWTSSPANSKNYSWAIFNSAINSIITERVDDSDHHGVRPVITISTSLLN